MGLKEIRKNRNMSQSELSALCGINYRSLQDYEQGHKKLTSANGDILLRLSTVLGCSIAEVLLTDAAVGASLHPSNKVDIATIRSKQFYCEKHKVAGRWICNDQKVATMFYFRGKQYLLPFDAVFTPVMLPCLMESAALQIEEEIDDILLRESGFEETTRDVAARCTSPVFRLSAVFVVFSYILLMASTRVSISRWV